MNENKMKYRAYLDTETAGLSRYDHEMTVICIALEHEQEHWATNI